MIVQTLRSTLPEVARQSCDDPVALPDRAMPAREVVSFWARDRTALRQCEARRAAAVAAVEGAP